MKVNFYNEIRQMIKEELKIGTEELKQMIFDEIKQTIKSMVNNANIQIGKGAYDINKLIRDELQYSIKCNATQHFIYERIKEEVSRQLSNKIQITVSEK